MMCTGPINNVKSTDPDDEKTYEEHSLFLENTTERLKNKDASDILEMGNSLLNEIEQKKIAKRLEIEPLIDYILKKSKKYTREYLLDFEHRDVKAIYDELKEENICLFDKLCKMFINS